MYTPLLERLLVVQIDSYPQYSERMQSACGRAILKVLVAMASKGPVLWSFISSVGESTYIVVVHADCITFVQFNVWGHRNMLSTRMVVILYCAA